ncbi:hypothetical protein F5Y04DRAFT_261105 [Hypomontagnella monticulosa]|nr:hypothetical protein F5Y04DRAFT_261105 [Hypomontagnella monticulosa]
MASVDYPYGSEPYSTLEVRNVESSAPQDLGCSNKEAVLHPESQYPQTVATYPKEDASKLEADYAGAIAGQGQSDGTAKRKIGGLSPRMFYILVAGVILIVIGAVVGGVVGGLASRRNETDSPPEQQPEPGTTSPSNILSTSKLAASNWTDPQGVIHRSVFFQDPYNSLITRQWDSQNRTWMTRNLSQFMQSSTTGRIHPIPGTSLASVSGDNKWGSMYEVHVFFSEIDSNDSATFSWVSSKNPRGNPDFWVYGTSEVRTWNGTQLAAAWERCSYEKCVGNWAVAYQGREGFINVANASDWSNNTKPAVRASAVSAGASMALLPALNGAYVDGLSLAVQRRPGSMIRTSYLGSWEWKQDDGMIIDDVDPLETRQFAATMMNNWKEALYVALSTDGGIRAARWDGNAYNEVPKINFVQGQSTNFSAIAMTTDAMFYGISDDEIWEYAIDISDPSTFTLAGKVYP